MKENGIKIGCMEKDCIKIYKFNIKGNGNQI